MEQGLIPRYICVWEDCDSGVFLSDDPNEARSYPEAADENEDIPEEWYDDIVIFAVNSLYLNKTLLETDPHIYWTENPQNISSWIYRGFIPPEAIKLV